jgi:S1-C subfamily serine protease
MELTSPTSHRADQLSDLAVIKIKAPNLTPASLDDSSKVNVGDTAIAYGAPLGLTGTVTDGIISTPNRTIEVATPAVPNVAGTDSGQGNRVAGLASLHPTAHKEPSRPPAATSVSMCSKSTRESTRVTLAARS